MELFFEILNRKHLRNHKGIKLYSWTILTQKGWVESKQMFT